MSCRVITAVLTCAALPVPSHLRAATASSPVLTASMAIVQAPMLLITLRQSRRYKDKKKAVLGALVENVYRRLYRDMLKNSASYAKLDSHGATRIDSLAAVFMP